MCTVSLCDHPIQSKKQGSKKSDAGVGQYLKKGVGNAWDVRNTLPAMFFRAIYIEPGIEARSTKVIFTLFVKTPKKVSKRFTIGDKFYNRRQISNKFPKI